ncbi:Uu.00g113300.m01.CDS01 [Anthostomella pinea]|uniref:Uu.00g113300.m01.CDS01 n=1 Tax=Anthostomella pinea TaxID=933095 RepID=A0AAI8VFY8_9PEZI|nr:Uu.00g113300.m01.CDS01 [Anthostomella pinea]
MLPSADPWTPSGNAKAIDCLQLVRKDCQSIDNYGKRSLQAVAEHHGGLLKHTSIEDIMTKFGNCVDAATVQNLVEQLGALHAAQYTGSGILYGASPPDIPSCEPIRLADQSGDRPSEEAGHMVEVMKSLSMSVQQENSRRLFPKFSKAVLGKVTGTIRLLVKNLAPEYYEECVKIVQQLPNDEKVHTDPDDFVSLFALRLLPTDKLVAT